MPIRFRCQYCNQLLGIARRKSGTLVQCPNCHRNVLVPNEDEPFSPNGPADPAAAAPPAPIPMPAPVPAPAPNMFDRDDFDMLLRPQQSMAGEPMRQPNAPHRTPVPPPRPLPQEPLPQPPPIWPASEPPMQAGLILSPTRATVLTVVVILMLAVAFGAGLLVGRFYL